MSSEAQTKQFLIYNIKTGQILRKVQCSEDHIECQLEQGVEEALEMGEGDALPNEGLYRVEGGSLVMPIEGQPSPRHHYLWDEGRWFDPAEFLGRPQPGMQIRSIEAGSARALREVCLALLNQSTPPDAAIKSLQEAENAIKELRSKIGQ